MKIIGPEANLFYLGIQDEIRDTEITETLELEDSLYLDLDTEKHSLGPEFAHIPRFQDFLKGQGGMVNLREHLEDPETFPFGVGSETVGQVGR